MELIREIEFYGRTMKVIIGKTAKQADGAVWIQYGDTVVHVAAVSLRERMKGTDFLPLMVDYREKYSAAGKIPGGFFKREGKPHEGEILTARMIDRPIRPLFPDGYAYDTQVMAMVLSHDGENDASILGPTGASLALCISDIPMSEAIAAVRVGLIDGEYVINPSLSQLAASRLDLVVVGSGTAITMVEGHADELTDQQLIDGLFFGHEAIKKLVAFEREIIAEAGKPTREFELPVVDPELIAAVDRIATDEIAKIANSIDKTERKTLNRELITRALEETASLEDVERTMAVKARIEELLRNAVRANILDNDRRLDGRSSTDIRPITCEVGLLPRAHGSSLFTRGQTQALGTVTLGTKDDEQKIDSLDDQGVRKYMLHYNFPPYSTGEVKYNFSTSRREVGHGKLGERALQAVLPEWDSFPYTVRVTSDILESNGSSSMATVCAGSLALMDAGVPIRKAVAGIAMGLVLEGDRFRILTDILGDEDHLGDMDFKVAGTRDGITAFQMDIKVQGISAELMARALKQAGEARFRILDIMDRTIPVPRGDISPYAPRFLTVMIPIDRIGALIGPGGKNIREIIAQTNTTIDVDDTGTVRIGSTNSENAAEARRRVEDLTAVPVEGKIYNGTVKKITDFGAFVEIIPGTEGLLHISEIERFRIKAVSDYLAVGDKVQVKLLAIDPANGKLSLSRKALLPDDGQVHPDEPREPRPPRSDHFHGHGGGRPGGGGRPPRR